MSSRCIRSSADPPEEAMLLQREAGTSHHTWSLCWARLVSRPPIRQKPPCRGAHLRRL
jgi:hypothetical protein